jgi:predicted DNA-binding transcriptional regulator YafY
MASRLERLVSLDAYIRNGSYPSVQKLCQLFEVRSRTIYSDLRELREMFGLDIRYDRERNGYFNADPSKTLPPLAVSYEEALLMTIAIEVLSASFGPSFHGALARVSEMLRSSDDQSFSWIRDFVQLEDRANCEVKCSVLTAVARAALTKQPATLTIITVVPEKVLYEDGHWYLHSRSTKSKSGELIETKLCSVTEVQLQTDTNGTGKGSNGPNGTSGQP